MALTYAESAALMKNAGFIDRVRVAMLKYASYILGEPSNATAHNTRVKWAQGIIMGPDQAAIYSQPVVMDPAVQDTGDPTGAAVTDAALQAALEVAVNKLF